MNLALPAQQTDTYLSMDHFLRVIEKRAFNIARLSLKERHDALDVVQEAMLSFVSLYARKPMNEWRPLFFKVLNSKIIDWHRRHKQLSRWALFVDSLPLIHLDTIERFNTAPCVGEVYELERQLELIRARLPNMPTRQQQAFIYRLVEGFSVQETAQIMKCSEGSVKTHLSRARKFLATELEDLI
ncbi:MAG: RNA polymerase sigma factor [Gammaproteobacteria bacterium]|nr:RNA polymerase sigma factor [Gammaproteobacteria bacterium]